MTRITEVKPNGMPVTEAAAELQEKLLDAIYGFHGELPVVVVVGVLEVIKIEIVTEYMD